MENKGIDVSRLEDMKRGWLVGNFLPSVWQTSHMEVGVKSYKAGDYEPYHVHKVATEITVIVSGKVQMNGITYSQGSIIRLQPGYGSDFLALEDTYTTVVKYPSVSNDKYTESLPSC